LLTLVLSTSEDLHGAVLYHLVVDDKIEEALDLFGKMEEQQSGLTTTPGTSSYNAILLAHVRSQSWDAALSLYEIMKEKDISANPQTIQSLVLATYKTGGKLSVLTLLESLLATGEAIFDERTVLLAARVLLPDAPGSIDGIRSMLRVMGDRNESLKRPALDLTRSLRTAQVEQNRRVSKNQPKARVKPQEEGETWHSALAYLLTLVRASSTPSS
jgi:pentatricopeptide repeat protein